ncbi:hypothetical protein, partial [Cysteiniphilum sp. 6C5]
LEPAKTLGSARVILQINQHYFANEIYVNQRYSANRKSRTRIILQMDFQLFGKFYKNLLFNFYCRN